MTRTSKPKPQKGKTGKELAREFAGVYMPGEGYADDLEFIQANQPRLAYGNTPEFNLYESGDV